MHYSIIYVGDKNNIPEVLDEYYGDRYDWYKIGGRFHDHFLLHDGTETYTAQLKEIDLRSIIEREKNRLESVYKNIHENINGNPNSNEVKLSAKRLSFEEWYDKYKRHPLDSYAILYNGEWKEQHEYDAEGWYNELIQFYNNLPVDTELTVVDLHY